MGFSELEFEGKHITIAGLAHGAGPVLPGPAVQAEAKRLLQSTEDKFVLLEGFIGNTSFGSELLNTISAHTRFAKRWRKILDVKRYDLSNYGLLEHDYIKLRINPRADFEHFHFSKQVNDRTNPLYFAMIHLALKSPVAARLLNRTKMLESANIDLLKQELNTVHSFGKIAISSAAERLRNTGVFLDKYYSHLNREPQQNKRGEQEQDKRLAEALEWHFRSYVMAEHIIHAAKNRDEKNIIVFCGTLHAPQIMAFLTNEQGVLDQYRNFKAPIISEIVGKIQN